MTVFTAEQLAYLRETLQMQIEQDAEAGFVHWTGLLDQVMTASDFAAAQYLLAAMKQIVAADDRGLSPVARYLIHTTEASTRAQMSQWDESRSAYEKALVVARQMEDESAIAWVLSDLGNVNYLSGLFHLAQSNLETALQTYQRQGDK